jgi:hypothetical protein
MEDSIMVQPSEQQDVVYAARRIADEFLISPDHIANLSAYFKQQLRKCLRNPHESGKLSNFAEEGLNRDGEEDIRTSSYIK